MKVKIENFGPVKDFTFDTEKKFHLIVGDNNVGKSYVLNVFYFALKSLLDLSPMSRRVYLVPEFYLDEDEDTLDRGKEVEDFKARIKGKKSGSFDATNLYEHFAKSFIQETFAESFSSKIESSYFEDSSIINTYSESKAAKITIYLSGLQFTLEGDIGEFKITSVALDKKTTLRIAKQNRNPAIIKNKLVIYALDGSTIESILDKVKRTCFTRIIQEISNATKHILDIDYLPASRSGLYQALSAFGQIIAELSKSRSFLSSKIELPGISGQLSDYFIKLTNITTPDKYPKEFETLAEKIESDVLKGNIEFDFKEKKLYYKPQGTNLRLDISSTSSMVSETAPIVTYIRHIIAWNKNDLRTRMKHRRKGKTLDNNSKKLLIIEEPEAHLHPENQIKMTQLYADLANLNVSIIMTSHSNYIFNKLSNIVIEGKLTPEEVRCDLFEMGVDGSTGKEQRVDEYGIDDQNFGDTSEKLLNERIDLLTEKEF